MDKTLLQEVTTYVEQNIGNFHQSRLVKLKSLKLKEVLSKKNPYLFKAKNVLKAQDIVENVLSAFLSSSEETIFGNWLEGLAIFISRKVHGGYKSSGDSIDLELEKDGIRYIVIIKSGPKWGNANQLSKMYSNFNEAKKRIGTSGNKESIVFVNGCCYGRETKNHKYPKKGPDYLKLCGQEFWEFISGNENLYTELIMPLGHKAQEKNDEYKVEYSNVVNRFTQKFTEDFCNADGSINWEEIVKNSSSKPTPKSPKNTK